MPIGVLCKMRCMYRKFLYLTIAALLLIPPTLAWSAPNATPPAGGPLDQPLRQLLTPAAKVSASYSLAVKDISTGRWLCGVNPQRALMPASNMKLVTTAAALGVLGPEFQFRTILATRGGDLLLIGSGDPGLGDAKLCAKTNTSITEVFDRWAGQLRKAGITQIAGRFIVDASIFDDELRHPSWPKDQLNRWYAAPVAGLNFNDNCLDITVNPPAANGAGAEVIVVPSNSLIEVIGNTQSLKFNPAARKSSVRALWSDKWQVQVKGKLSKRPAGPIYLPLSDPVPFIAYLCRQHLQDAGIQIAGQSVKQTIRQADGSLPGDIRIIGTHSTDIKDVIFRANCHSQNLFAECLLKMVGFHRFGHNGKKFTPGSWLTGQQAIKEFLVTAIGPTLAQQVSVGDGSGLSRTNRISAQGLAELLAYMANGSNSEDFVSSLAIAGKRGKLGKRLRGTRAKNRIYAKTGYISGVSALSGYVMDRQGRPAIAFAMLFNDVPNGKTWQMRQIQDKICLALVSHADRTGKPTNSHAVKQTR